MTKYLIDIIYDTRILSLYYDEFSEVYFIACDPDINSAVDYNKDLLILFQNNDLPLRDYPTLFPPTL